MPKNTPNVDKIPYGYCHCGCGEKTNIADKNHTKSGTVKGQPRLFIVGHNPKKKTKEPGEKPCGSCACGCGTPIYPGRYQSRQPHYAPGHTGRWTQTAEQRFWAKVNKLGPNGCWEWTGSTGAWGYGSFGINGGHIGSHRYSWEIHYGPIFKGMFVCHHCDNPACVNPSHLFLGTHADNMRDMSSKGRNRKLTPKQILSIRKLYQSGKSQDAIAKLFNIGQSHVSRIVRREMYEDII